MLVRGYDGRGVLGAPDLLGDLPKLLDLSLIIKNTCVRYVIERKVAISEMFGLDEPDLRFMVFLFVGILVTEFVVLLRLLDCWLVLLWRVSFGS